MTTDHDDRTPPGMTGDARRSQQWYYYHFGSHQASSADFQPDALFGRSFRGCFVLVADFCSFSKFLWATPEVEIINPLLTSMYTDMRRSIQGAGGMLSQIVGDAVIGVWGIPGTTSDSAQVLACARQITEIGIRYARQWQNAIDLVIEPQGMRSGLSKGEIAVIKRDSDYEGMACLGSAINLATRLQVLAEPNELLCSNAAHRDVDAVEGYEFAPYQGDNGEMLINAKNFGPVKAWRCGLAPRDA